MARGRLAEMMLEMVNGRLAAAEIAFVTHTHPSTRVVGRDEGGPMLRFGSGGAPDYQGTLAGGRAVVFELKSTEERTFTWQRAGRGRRELTRLRQLAAIELHGRLGALAGVLVAFTGGLKRGQQIEFAWVDWAATRALMSGGWSLDGLMVHPGGRRVVWARGDPDWIAAALAAEQQRPAPPRATLVVT